MRWGGRASHYVAAGALVVGMLVWGGHEAWPSRETPVALPIVITSAYDEWADTLGRREMLADVLTRAGITGAEYVRFMKATHVLNPRRLQPGLIFQVRRLKGAAVASRIGVRTEPQRRVWVNRPRADSRWAETVEGISWRAQRVGPTAGHSFNPFQPPPPGHSPPFPPG